MTGREHAESCFTDFAMQEYVQGRLDAEVRGEIEAHLGDCAECRRAADMLRAEAEVLREVFLTGLPSTGGETPDLSALAAYLDGALEPEAAVELESRLARDPRLLHALTQLQAEVDAVEIDALVAQPGGAPAKAVPEPPEGQILRMPKRTAPPPVVASDQLRLGGGQSA